MEEIIVQTSKNDCCRVLSNLEIDEVENNENKRSIFKCKICEKKYYGKINQDTESLEIIHTMKKKGLSLEGTIIHGFSAMKFIVPDIQKLVKITRNLAKVNKIQCNGHNINDVIVDENGIFCKNCGLKLGLYPEWYFGSINTSG